MENWTVALKATVQFFIYMETPAINIGRISPYLIGFFLISLIFCHAAYAETIILKSHKIIEAPILKKTDTYIIVDNKGVSEKYGLSDVETVIDDSVNYGPVSYAVPFPASENSQSKTDIFFYGNELDAGDNSHALITNFKESNKAEEMIRDVKENFDQHFLNK